MASMSIPASWHYVVFMKREHSAYLHMRFDILYSIYLLFVAVVIIRHIRLAVLAIRGWPEVDEALKSSTESML